MNSRQHWMAGLVGTGVVLVSLGLAAAQSSLNGLNGVQSSGSPINGLRGNLGQNQGNSISSGQINGLNSNSNSTNGNLISERPSNGVPLNTGRLTPHQNTQGLPPSPSLPPFLAGPSLNYGELASVFGWIKAW